MNELITPAEFAKGMLPFFKAYVELISIGIQAEADRTGKRQLCHIGMASFYVEPSVSTVARQVGKN